MLINLIKYSPSFRPLESIQSTDKLGKAFLAAPLLHNLFFAIKIAEFERAKEKVSAGQWQKLLTDASYLKWATLVTTVALAAIAMVALTATTALYVASVVLLVGSLLFVDMCRLGTYAATLPIPPGGGSGPSSTPVPPTPSPTRSPTPPPLLPTPPPAPVSLKQSEIKGSDLHLVHKPRSLPPRMTVTGSSTSLPDSLSTQKPGIPWPATSDSPSLRLPKDAHPLHKPRASVTPKSVSITSLTPSLESHLPGKLRVTGLDTTPPTLPAAPLYYFTPQEKEVLEKKFWEEVPEKSLSDILATIIALEKRTWSESERATKEINWSEGERARRVLDYSVTLKQIKNPYFSFSENETLQLLSQIERVLAVGYSRQAPIAKEKSVKVLTDGRKLHVYPTPSDGSCGFHALLGTRNKEGYFHCDSVAKRNEFCDWLQSQFNAGKLPEQIRNSLENCFLFFDLAEMDANLKTDLEKWYRVYREPYEKLSNEIEEQRKVQSVENPEAFVSYSQDKQKELDQIQQQFTADKDVFAAYLNHMRKLSTYLSQTELELVAIYFKKRFYLCQQGWYNDSGKNTYSECNGRRIFDNDPIYIWYGSNHFERAFLVDPSLTVHFQHVQNG